MSEDYEDIQNEELDDQEVGEEVLEEGEGSVEKAGKFDRLLGSESRRF